MTIASANIFPKVTLVEGAAPASPAATNFSLYFDSSDHLLKWKNSAGTVTTIATGSSGLTDPMTTRGDVIIRNASNVTARLGIGTTGKVLQSDGTDISWQTPSAGSSTFSGAKAYHSTTQALTTATVTPALFNSEEFDTDAYHSTVTNTSRMTIPSGKDGTFLLRGMCVFAQDAGGVRIARFLKNGSTILRTQYSDGGSGSAAKSAQIGATIALVATDYVEFTVYQTTGGNLNIGNASAAEEQTSFELIRLG